MLIDNLFPSGLLGQMLEGGYVRRQAHPTLPLMILNYTEKAQFEHVWNEVTRQCRGLIYNHETGEVLARPFMKFHNHDEPDAPVFDISERVTVTDKMDGSLGILYPTGEGTYAIATRGSFTSDQAIHATQVWSDRYAGRFTPAAGVTYLFEIIYPANRIVVDYRGMDDLVLLGSVDITYGCSFNPADSEAHGFWPGPRTATFHYETFGEALASGPRPGCEGFVVRRAENEDRVKIKYADYVALHRIVTGLNARTVWEHLGAMRPLSELIETLPDEFHGWVSDVAEQLSSDAGQIVYEAETLHRTVVANLPAGYTRKDFAMVAKNLDARAYLFRLEDGRDVADMAWKAVRPGADWTPSGVTHDEDAA